MASANITKLLSASEEGRLSNPQGHCLRLLCTSLENLASPHQAEHHSSALPTDSVEAITKCERDSTDQMSLQYKGTKSTMLISAEQAGKGGSGTCQVEKSQCLTESNSICNL